MEKEGTKEVAPDFTARLADFLKLEVGKVNRLFEKNYLAWNWGDYRHLLRFDKEIFHIERGTVLYEKAGTFETVPGFPKIRRAMVLYPTLERQFQGLKKVSIEEKMNGYNVRVARINKEILAITRSGYICPYTTERARLKLNIQFFEDFPDLVLYGEMVGPDNPYVPKKIYNLESLEFYIFDVREKNTGKPLPIERRRKLLEKYGFLQVKAFGEIPLETAPEKIKAIVLELGKSEHEGVVIKDPEMIIPPVKYTASQSNCSDLRHAFKFYNESSRDYMLSRIVREGFQAVEWAENETEFQNRCLQLGESILFPLRDTIRSIKEGQRLYEEVQIRVKTLKTAAAFEEFLKRLGIDAVFGVPLPVGDEYIITIRKAKKSTNDKTRAVWEGELW